MTKRILLLCFMFIVVFASAQKKDKKKDKYDLDYDKKTGIISVNDVEVFKFTEEKVLEGKEYTLYSLDGEELILLVPKSFKDYHEISSSNPTGTVRYYQVMFFDENNSSCEIDMNFFKTTMAVLDQNGLIIEGILDSEAVELFVLKYGNNYTELMKSR